MHERVSGRVVINFAASDGHVLMDSLIDMSGLAGDDGDLRRLGSAGGG